MELNEAIEASGGGEKKYQTTGALTETGFRQMTKVPKKVRLNTLSSPT